jgi:hypothetical protein
MKPSQFSPGKSAPASPSSKRHALKRDAENLKAETIRRKKPRSRPGKVIAMTYMVRSADLRSPAPNGHFLREFGQSDRELVENSNDEASVGQALMLLNGKTFTSW